MNWLTEQIQALIGRLGAGAELASLQFYEGPADEHGGRPARAYVVTAEALFEATYSPGEQEPLVEAGTGRRLPAWRLQARRVEWDEAPPLRASADDAHRGADRAVRTAFLLGDVPLPSTTGDEEAKTVAFAKFYWQHRVTSSSVPTQAFLASRE